MKPDAATMRSRTNDATPNGNGSSNSYHDGKGTKGRHGAANNINNINSNMNINNNNNKLESIACLRWMLLILSIACFFQVTQRQGLGLFGGGEGCPGANVFYIDDGQTLQRVNPDAPLVSYGVRGRGSSNNNNNNNNNNNYHNHQKKKAPVPRFVVDPLFKAEQDRIDHGMDDTARCAQYGLSVLPPEARKKHDRRIFFGSMLANENPEVLVAHALEVYNHYDVIALVESNTTHGATPRVMHYGPGSGGARTLTESELFGFGNTTEVVIDYWLEDEPDLSGMDREVEQRNLIWKIWVDKGMAPWDVGIMADLDEVVSRDFLNALKVCDFPKLRHDDDHDPDQRPNCQTPKMALSTMQFESSPLCIKNQEWFHPDLIPGHCVLGVGDSTGRVLPERNRHIGGARKIPAGNRKGEWGSHDYNRYPRDVIENNRFPLWDGRDIREVNGNADNLVNYVDDYKAGMFDTAVYGTAYHLHNWFRDLSVLRHKYETYGHASSNAGHKILSEIQGDLDVLVRCVRGLGNQPPPEVGKLPHDGYPYYTTNKLLPLPLLPPEGSELSEDGNKKDHGNKNNKNKNVNDNSMFTMGGNRPIYFQNRTYVEERHALIRKLVLADEKKYGSLYRTRTRTGDHDR